MLKNRYSVTGGNRLNALSSVGPSDGRPSIRSARANVLGAVNGTEQGTKDRVKGNFGGILGVPGTGAGGGPVQGLNTGGMQWNRYMTGIAPEDDASLVHYYRDCYSFDSVAGATVDMQASFPFSDFTLVGVEKKDVEIYNESISRMNIRSLMSELMLSYLVDGAFIGTLIIDPKTKSFQDLLIHDKVNCTVKSSPFFVADPEIIANSAQNLNQFLNSTSPYVKAITQNYPKPFLDMLLRGPVTLDPLTTIYIPRRGNRDQPSYSYLRRVLPMYFLEKTMYRGTLIEAQKRMRATTHIQVGTDSWEPTPGEMQEVLGNFQMSEIDPLGAWVVTRQGVNVTDIRQGGDFWKWTDLIDTLVPYKLRALGISEAFLSGEAAFNTAETAMTVFTEKCAADRSLITQKFFREKFFPIIAVINGLYKNAQDIAPGRSVESLVRNVQHFKNLRIPEVYWHKNLDNHDPTLMDTLNELSTKNIPVPLKMWAAAANINLDMLLGDLELDSTIRAKIEAITGTPIDDAATLEGGEGGEELARVKAMGFRNPELQRLEAMAELRSTANPALSRRRSLLQRSFIHPDGTPMDTPVKLSKSGKVVHAVVNEKEYKAKTNEAIYKAAKALRDPNRYAQVKADVIRRSRGQ